jgi:hypothetical protein
MYEEFRKEYELAHQDELSADRDDLRLGLRANTHALRRVLDELRRDDGRRAAGA